MDARKSGIHYKRKRSTIEKGYITPANSWHKEVETLSYLEHACQRQNQVKASWYYKPHVLASSKPCKYSCQCFSLPIARTYRQ